MEIPTWGEIKTDEIKAKAYRQLMAKEKAYCQLMANLYPSITSDEMIENGEQHA